MRRSLVAAVCAALTAGGTLASPGGAASQEHAPAWTHGAVCYEVFVRSFFDSDGDGVGDLNGLIDKLDYINDGDPASKKDLGASCIWLMPVSPSPSYHGYDVTDYYGINRDYGTVADFKRLVAEAHRRGIRIVVDMVLNHSSSRHPHFLAALRDTASPYRAWYRFVPKVPADSLGPWGTPVWRRSPVRDEYYYGLFSPGMPDLNYHDPAVRDEAMKIASFWLRDMGVDGLRLDAIQYLVEEGSCKMDCAGTHQFLRQYQAHIDSVKPGAYTVGEVWDSLGELLTYYPHQLSSYFTFPLRDSLVAAVRRGTAGGMLSGYERMADTLPSWRWATLIDNHDMTRVLTALDGSPVRARVAATLLLTLPGLPFVYYGEEIGMSGDKPDPRLRTPMQWSPKPGVGFTTGAEWEAPQADSMTTNVAGQDADPGSLLNLYRRLIHLRKRNAALAAGRLIPLEASDTHAAAYLRRVDAASGAPGAAGAAVLVVSNLDTLPRTGVSLASRPGALPPGSYEARSLLGGPGGRTLSVDGDGRISGYVPTATLAPGQSLVLELLRDRGGATRRRRPSAAPKDPVSPTAPTPTAARSGRPEKAS